MPSPLPVKPKMLISTQIYNTLRHFLWANTFDVGIKVHPGVVGWRRIAQTLPEVKPDHVYAQLFIDGAAVSVWVLFTLFGVGKLIFGEGAQAGVLLALAAGAGGLIYGHLAKIGWDQVAE